MLSLVEGRAVSGTRMPFLADIALHARLLVALPLFLVAELTRAQNGSISATDDLPGGGTLLQLSLPGLGAR